VTPELERGPDVSGETFRKCLVYLFLLGLIVRAGFMVAHERTPSYGVLTLDQKYYDTAARMILAGEDLRPLRGLRPLLYPFFLALVYRAGGAHGVDLALAAQHLFGVLTGLTVAWLGARVFRRRAAGLGAGLLYLLAPVPLAFEGELLIESSYGLLVCLGLALACVAAGASGRKAAGLWLASGALTLLTAQDRPNFLVVLALYPLLAGWMWWRQRQLCPWRPLWGLLGAALMAVPWGFVNKMQSDRFQIIPSAGGVNFYLGNRRGADGMQPEQGRRVTYGERYEDSVEIWAREEYEAAMRAEGRTAETSPAAISRYWSQRGWAEIKADPAAWCRLMGRKCWLLCWNTEVPNNKSLAFMETENVWLRWLPIRWVVILAFVPAGIWAAWRWGGREALFIVAGYIALSAGADLAFFICDRYRLPLWPACAVLAGGGVIGAVDALRQRRGRTLGGIAASAAVVMVVSLPNWFHVRLPSFARDYLFRSIAWYEKGRFPLALADVDSSLALDPGEVTALHQRGNVLLAMDLPAQACQDYERTLAREAGDGGIWNNYGLALDSTGRTNEALQAFRRAIACQPPSASAYLGIAFEEIRAGRLAEATRALDALDALRTRADALSLAVRAVIAQKEGNAALAQELEGNARKLDPKATAWAIDRANSKGPIRP
jgi:4-amino-4-deoxy-L-arabinose transferase-like glycosyltransferase/Tfp pilus assembly protein PilF